MKKWIMIVGLSLCAFAGHARNIKLVNIQVGETFGDSTATQDFSEEHVGKHRISLKVHFQKNTWLGAWAPRRKDWSRTKSVTIQAYNPSEKSLPFTLTTIPKHLADEKRYDEKAEHSFQLMPGENTITLKTRDFKTRSGLPIDWSDILQYYFTTEAAPCTVYWLTFHMTQP